jgi:hypothetical protein
MPARNGSGPMGAGPGTGRGMGYCNIYRPGFPRMQGRPGMGRGRRGGFGWGFPGPNYAGVSQVDDLKSYQYYLQKELNFVKQLLNQDE